MARKDNPSRRVVHFGVDHLERRTLQTRNSSWVAERLTTPETGQRPEKRLAEKVPDLHVSPRSTRSQQHQIMLLFFVFLLFRRKSKRGAKIRPD